MAEVKVLEKGSGGGLPPKKIKVTSDRDVDFLSLGWGINAGQVRELPVEEESQAIILKNQHITKIN